MGSGGDEACVSSVNNTVDVRMCLLVKLAGGTRHGGPAGTLLSRKRIQKDISSLEIRSEKQ